MIESNRIGLDIETIISKAKKAAVEFGFFSQEKTDQIVKSVYSAGFDKRVYLAKLAHQETGIGKWEDKVIKNTIATRFVYQDIRELKTVGIINNDRENGIIEIAYPIGPVFATTPVTNPTSTALFKILIAIKSRNPIIISPHGRAKKCTIEAAKICYDAALAAGAPENCIQWIKKATSQEIQELMGHKKIALILATGTVDLVRNASKTGNPVIGVGAGNVPAYICKTADIPFSVEQIMLSKTFDFGTICASEQAVVATTSNSKQILDEFKLKGAYVISEDEIRLLEDVACNNYAKMMSVEIIGKTPYQIATMAGFFVPPETTLLIAPLKNVGKYTLLSYEILAPILAFYEVADFEEGIEICKQVNNLGGLGHTASIFSKDENNIMRFANEMNAGRILINTPSSQGAIGGTFNSLQPSFTLGVGTSGKSITTDNISARHLLNIKRIAYRKDNPCLSYDMDLYLNEEVTAELLDECDNKE